MFVTMCTTKAYALRHWPSVSLAVRSELSHGSMLCTHEQEDYERSLQKLHEADLKGRLTFLQNIFLFADWADEDLRRLVRVEWCWCW